MPRLTDLAMELERGVVESWEAIIHQAGHPATAGLMAEWTHELARAVLAQEQRVCGTCSWLNTVTVPYCMNHQAPLVEFGGNKEDTGETYGDPMTFGCPFHEPASEEAGK
jgi:hypothetical protein